MINANQKDLIRFVQDRAPELSIQKRISVYRGLADSLDDRELRRLFATRAAILEEAEARCAELKLTFNPKTK